MNVRKINKNMVKKIFLHVITLKFFFWYTWYQNLTNNVLLEYICFKWNLTFKKKLLNCIFLLHLWLNQEITHHNSIFEHKIYWCTPKCESQSENNEKHKNKVCSFIHNTFGGGGGVKGCAKASRWGLGRITSKSIIHIDLHKLNNKLVDA